MNNSFTQQMFTAHFYAGGTFQEAVGSKTNNIIRILELIFSMGRGEQKINNKHNMDINLIIFYKLLNAMGKNQTQWRKEIRSTIRACLPFLIKQSGDVSLRSYNQVRDLKEKQFTQWIFGREKQHFQEVKIASVESPEAGASLAYVQVQGGQCVCSRAGRGRGRGCGIRDVGDGEQIMYVLGGSGPDLDFIQRDMRRHSRVLSRGGI